mgnify:CR=1 FL=1
MSDEKIYSIEVINTNIKYALFDDVNLENGYSYAISKIVDNTIKFKDKFKSPVFSIYVLIGDKDYLYKHIISPNVELTYSLLDK